jgi:hypothetical protein
MAAADEYVAATCRAMVGRQAEGRTRREPAGVIPSFSHSVSQSTGSSGRNGPIGGAKPQVRALTCMFRL